MTRRAAIYLPLRQLLYNMATLKINFLIRDLEKRFVIFRQPLVKVIYLQRQWPRTYPNWRIQE